MLNASQTKPSLRYPSEDSQKRIVYSLWRAVQWQKFKGARRKERSQRGSGAAALTLTVEGSFPAPTWVLRVAIFWLPDSEPGLQQMTSMRALQTYNQKPGICRCSRRKGRPEGTS